MRTGTNRYAEHYEVAAYGESVVRWGYNHWWSKVFSLGFGARTLKNLGRITEYHVTSGWGMATGIFDVLNAKARPDQRCRPVQDTPSLEMFGFVSTPWVRIRYKKKRLTQKFTSFKKKYVALFVRKLTDIRRSDSSKIDPLFLGGPSRRASSELPTLCNLRAVCSFHLVRSRLNHGLSRILWRGCITLLLMIPPIASNAMEFLWAGFSFTGRWDQRAELYPYGATLSEEKDSRGLSILDAAMLEAIRGFKAENVKLNFDLAKNVNTGSGLTLALGVGGEQIFETTTVVNAGKSNEKRSTTVYFDVMARILVFDWQAKKLIAAFPIISSHSESYGQPPTPAQKAQAFRKIYTDLSFENNIIKRWLEKLSTAEIKDSYGNYCGISEVVLEEPVLNLLSKEGMKPATYQTLVAQTLESLLSEAQSISIVPFTSGEAVGGKMAMRFADQRTLNLKIPPADLNLAVTLRNFRHAEKVSGKRTDIFVAAYANADIFLEASGFRKQYFDADMKHILRALRLMTKEREAVGDIDLWYGYQVALQNLFVRFSNQLGDQDPKVIKSLSPDKDLSSDFKKLSEVIEKCR